MLQNENNQKIVNKFKSRSFLKLGMVGIFDDKQYRVVGRVVYKSDYKEWDSEDKRYCPRKWKFDEWILTTSSGEYLIIAEDKEGFSVSEEFTPEVKVIPKKRDSNINFQKGIFSKRILEKGTDHVIYVEGDFSDKPQMGEISNFAMYKKNGTEYSVEWSEGANEVVKKSNFYKDDCISKIDLLKKFQGYGHIEEEIKRLEVGMKKIKEYKFEILVLFIVIFSLLITPLFFNGERVFLQSYPVSKINNEEGVVTDSFVMDDVGEVYEIELSSSFSDNSWLWVSAELLDENGDTINVMAGDFWRESGRDSDGEWHESFTNTSIYFKLKNKGEYSFRIFYEAENKGVLQNSMINVKVEEGVVLYRYFMWLVLVCVVLIFVLFYKINSFSAYINEKYKYA